MKKNDLTALKAKSISDLKKKIAELQKERIQAEIDLKLAKVKNVHLKLAKKREIAKVKTILSHKSYSMEVKNSAN